MMADTRDESLAWDRVGRFLEQSGITASDIADRHLKLWATVSTHLRKGDKYTADDMAGDLASSMVTAMDNMGSIWSMLTTPSRQSQFAQNLPTVFLLFKWAGPNRHALLDPVRIEIDPAIRPKKDLPRRAKIAITGKSAPQNTADATVSPRDVPVGMQAPDSDGDPLLRALVARRPKRSRYYILETVNRRLSTDDQAPDPGTYVNLASGVYDGVVYLDDPVQALANLRIVVEAPPERPQSPGAQLVKPREQQQGEPTDAAQSGTDSDEAPSTSQ